MRRVFRGAPGRHDHDRGAALDRAGLRFSEQGLPWVLSAYALTFGGLLLLGGRRLTCSGARACFRPAATTRPALMVAGSLVLTQVELPEPDPRRLRRR